MEKETTQVDEGLDITVSLDKICNYIENEAEVLIPIEELIRKDGTHLTKKEYGHVLLKYLVIELRQTFKKNKTNNG